MVKLLNSLYLGASTPDDYGKATGVIELLPFDLYLGAATPSGIRTLNVLLSGVSPLTLLNAVSLNYIKAFGKCEQKSVFPEGYTQLEYIESTGTQVIDLGLKWAYNISTKTVCEMLAAESTALGCVGARSSATVVWGNFSSNTNNNYTCFGNKVNVTFFQNMVDGQFHEWETTNTGFYLDGVKKTDLSGSDDTLVSNDNIGLFGRYDGAGNIERCGQWRIKSHQTYDNNVLIQNLIPAKRNSDSVLGMYDTVSGNFFTNTGTGEFTAGGEATPSPDNVMPIWCNNGEIKFGRPITLDATRYYALIRGVDNNFAYSSDSYSIIVPVEVGKQYKLTADPTTPIDDIVNVILRWAFIDELPPDSWKVSSATVPTPSTITTYDKVRTTPQETPSIIVTATHPYMIVQMGAAIMASNIANGRISITEQSIYYDGTVETVSIGKGFDDVDGQGTFVTPSWSATTRVYKTFGQLPDGKYKVAISGNFEFIFQYKDETTTDYGNIGSWTTGDVFDLDKTGYYYGIAVRYPNNGTIRPSDFSGVISLIPVDNSATCQPLLSVGTFKDVQNITNGAITRNVGIKVLDGTENWFTLSTPSLYGFPAADGRLSDNCLVMSTHYVGTTVLNANMANGTIKARHASSLAPGKVSVYIKDTTFTTLKGFKAWLTAQYNAGTPVIVVYPLATPTTETVAGQTLTITQGTNVVTAEGSVDDLELEISYKAYAEVTVEEIEAVNTDENVEVTIS